MKISAVRFGEAAKAPTHLEVRVDKTGRAEHRHVIDAGWKPPLQDRAHTTDEHAEYARSHAKRAHDIEQIRPLLKGRTASMAENAITSHTRAADAHRAKSQGQWSAPIAFLTDDANGSERALQRAEADELEFASTDAGIAQAEAERKKLLATLPRSTNWVAWAAKHPPGTFYRVHPNEADPDALLHRNNQTSTIWYGDAERVCSDCGGDGRHARRSGASCPSCNGHGVVSDNTRAGISVMRHPDELRRYFGERNHHFDLARSSIVALQGDPSADKDFDSENGAMLIHPTKIIGTRQLDRTFIRDAERSNDDAAKAEIAAAALLRPFSIATPSEEAITADGPDDIDPFDGFNEHEKGRAFANEGKAQKARQRAAEQYGVTEADGERYWRVTAGIYKRSGGVFARPARPEAAKALEWVDLPEAAKAVSRRDDSTISMFDMLGAPPAKPAQPKGPSPTHHESPPAQPSLFGGGDQTHGGKLHQETRTDVTGRTQTRWVAQPEPPPADPAPPKAEPPEPPKAEPPEPPKAEPLIFADPISDPKGHVLGVSRALSDGTISAARLRDEWARWKSADLHVKAWLNKKTVPELKRMVVWASNYTKPQLISSIHSALSMRFNPADTLSHSMMETNEHALGRNIAAATDDTLAKYAANKSTDRAKADARKQASADAQAEVDRKSAEADARAENPTTAEDYERRIATKGRDSLTAEQKAEADELIAQRDRGRRDEAKASQEAAAAERRAKSAADARPSRDLNPEELEGRIEQFGQRVDSAERAYASTYETRHHGSTASAARRSQDANADAGKDLVRWRRRLDHARATLAWKRGQDDNPGEEPGDGPAGGGEAAAAADGSTTGRRAAKGSPLVGSAMTLHAGVHTKKGHAIWTAEPHNRVERDEYERLNNAAKNEGGRYSSFRGAGAIPGFVFDDEAAAHRFMGAHGGAATGGEEAAQEGQEGAEVEEAPPQVEPEVSDTLTGPAARAAKLRELAEDQHSAAQGVLNQDRRTNTLRRASMAAGIEGRAQSAQFLAHTTRNIADAMEAGDLKHIHGVGARRHVEALEDALQAAHYDAVRRRAKDRQDPRGWGSGNVREDEWHAPTTLDEIEHARPPLVRTRRENMRALAAAYDNIPPARRRGLKEAAEVARRHSHDRASDRGDHIATMNDEDAEKLRPLVERLARMPEHKWKAGEVADDLQEMRRWRRMGIHTPEELRAALREYHGLRGTKPQTDRLKEMQRELVATNIPGYFPTPPALARRAVALADIQPGHRVLEPSAGSGHMAREIKAAHPDARIDVIEQAPRLRGYLQEQGFNVVHTDHMAHSAAGEYDRIVMNPPFEGGADAAHIQHAYGKLKPGGRLVAVMSEGPFFRQDKKSQAFRDFIDHHEGTSEKLPAGSFAGPDADRTTGVATRMVVLHRPHADPTKMNRREYVDAYGAPVAPLQESHKSEAVAMRVFAVDFRRWA